MIIICIILVISIAKVIFSQLTVKYKIRRYTLKKEFRNEFDRHFSQWLRQRWIHQDWHEKRLIKSGISQSGSERRAWLWLGSLLVIGLTSTVISKNILKGIFAVGILEAAFFVATSQAAKARTAQFNLSVYKIYRSLSLQLTSGMSITDSLKRIHEAVEAPFMREALYAYASTYLKTMNVDKATRALTKHVEGQEVEILAAVLRQGIVSGDYYSLLEKQEKIMLRHYYQAIELETHWIKVKGIVIAVGISLLIFLLLLIPILYEMISATKHLFST